MIPVTRCNVSDSFKTYKEKNLFVHIFTNYLFICDFVNNKVKWWMEMLVFIHASKFTDIFTLNTLLIV